MNTTRLLAALVLLIASCGGDEARIEAAGSVSEYGVAVGDCFDDPPDFEYDARQLIPTACSQPHDNEVYVIGTATGPYPGDFELNSLADDFCLETFSSFIGLDWDESRYDFVWIVPDRNGWDDGERDVLCAAYDLDLLKITGTLRGIAS